MPKNDKTTGHGADVYRPKLAAIWAELKDDSRGDHGALVGLVELLEDMLGIERADPAPLEPPDPDSPLKSDPDQAA